MPVRIKAKRRSLLIRFLINPWGKAFLLAFVLTMGVGVSAFIYVYDYYARLTDEKLRAGPFSNTSLLYAAARPVMTGEDAKLEEIADYLRRCGYSESSNNRLGWFHLRADAIEVNPGPDAFDSEGAVIKIRGGKITEIISVRDQSQRNLYQLEPELMTNLFDKKREKRRIVHFNDIPKTMVNALLAAEDKHFFSHAGFDPVGIVRAAYKDVTEHRLEGASTLSMQLAGCLWLSEVDRGWHRKFAQTMITLHLERKLTKQQIFEDYVNAVPLGQVGSFSIQGFGQAADVYLGKDLSKVTVADAAFLAGLVQAPSRRNPFRHPDRATARRNTVLKAMLEDGFINDRQYQEGVETTLDVAHEEAESSDAPYFVDLVNDTLQSRFESTDFQADSYRVYTTLDPALQRDAVAAVKIGIEETDTAWKRHDKKYGTDEIPLAQVALVCIDSETGEVKALVGGRNYGISQLDHAMSKRPPGSSFKPFVYAAGFATALRGDHGGTVITPATVIADEPTTFWYDDKPYEPSNFKHEFFGDIPAWFALVHSLNIPTVKIAEMTGYENVAKVARGVGLNVEATPSIALGSYEVTPLEIAGAYTVFPNGGELISTSFIKSIRDQTGKSVYQAQATRKQAMDARVAYLVENTMEEVLRSGTGAAVRAKGFTLPAAGKTGTDPHNGWFAGFTSKLICVVWVGFDDNRDFRLEGAHSALPIWLEFMKRAHSHREYKSVHSFDAPDGIVTVQIDAATGELATPQCPKVRNQVFISGTQPVDPCHLHGAGKTEVASWDTPSPGTPVPAVPETRSPSGSPPPKTAARSIPITPATGDSGEQPEKKKKGFFGRLRDAFRDDKSKDNNKDK